MVEIVVKLPQQVDLIGRVLTFAAGSGPSWGDVREEVAADVFLEVGALEKVFEGPFLAVMNDFAVVVAAGVGELVSSHGAAEGAGESLISGIAAREPIDGFGSDEGWPECGILFGAVAAELDGEVTFEGIVLSFREV